MGRLFWNKSLYFVKHRGFVRAKPFGYIDIVGLSQRALGRSFVFIHIVGLTFILEFLKFCNSPPKRRSDGFRWLDAMIPAREAVVRGWRLTARRRGG